MHRPLRRDDAGQEKAILLLVLLLKLSSLSDKDYLKFLKTFSILLLIIKSLKKLCF